jgi:hypothetical protein
MNTGGYLVRRPVSGRHPDVLEWRVRQWRRSGSITPTRRPFERTSKRRKGFSSETRVRRGVRIVHGEKELSEKLGRNDLCPCDSTRRFQGLLHAVGPVSTARRATTTFRE